MRPLCTLALPLAMPASVLPCTLALRLGASLPLLPLSLPFTRHVYSIFGDELLPSASGCPPLRCGRRASNVSGGLSREKEAIRGFLSCVVNLIVEERLSCRSASQVSMCIYHQRSSQAPAAPLTPPALPLACAFERLQAAPRDVEPHNSAFACWRCVPD